MNEREFLIWLSGAIEGRGKVEGEGEDPLLGAIRKRLLLLDLPAEAPTVRMPYHTGEARIDCTGRRVTRGIFHDPDIGTARVWKAL